MKKRKLLYCVCVALILSLSLTILAAAARMNRNSPLDLMPGNNAADSQSGGDAATESENNTDSMDTPLIPENSTGNGIVTDDVTNPNDNMTLIPDQPAKDQTDTDMMPDTNIPDADIGGAVGDNDSDSVPDAVDSDDDNDGVRDPVDSDADGDGTDDEQKTMGIVGIVITVAVVIAVILVIIAVVPKKPKDS
jgi:hypothetical protein